MVSRRRFLLASAGAAAGVLAGCSDDPGPPASTPEPIPSSTPSSALPSESPSKTPTPTPSPTPAPSGPPRPRLAGTVATDLDVPWGMAFLASGDAIISERNTARLRRVTRRGKVTTLGEVPGVNPPADGEGGLLGIAFAPGDEETLFVYLTTADDNRVVRISLAGGRVGRPRPVLTGIPSNQRHNGGALLFGADGLLYVATGDASESARAQDRDSLAGKILRIRANGRAAPGNPFGNRTWSYGHRNVEGLAFDGRNRLWATEFGEQETDELNVIRRGRNYGWPQVEGRSRVARFASPRASWSPTSTCSPAGLAITRSTAFVGALRGQCLFAVPLSGTRAGEPKAYFAGDHGRIRNVTVAPDGALWVTTSNTDGRVEPGRDDDKILRVTL